MGIDKLYLTWEDFEKYANRCYQQIKDLKIEQIITPMYGGFYLADYLKRKLNVPLICVFKEMNVLQKLDYKTNLIVDDIYDTGKTIKDFNDYLTHFNKEHTFYNCCLIERLSASLNTIHGFLEPSNKYIVFPWEEK